MTNAESSGNLRKSRRIANNTLLLFARIFVITIVNLYAVRIVLSSLGDIDYGIFNSIAGVVLTSTFLSQTLALSIQRFYSYSIGEQAWDKLREIFSASMLIVFVLSVFIVMVFESIGYWLIETKMLIPADRLFAAKWIFQFALFSFVVTLLQIPFTAAVFAHEDMGIYALFSTIDCLLRLFVAWLIGQAVFDHLIFYGSGLLAVAVFVFLLYAVTACILYPECRYRKVSEKNTYKELLSFSGWTIYGNLSGVAMIQGSTILLNVFFGPLANAAFAVANQIYNAISAMVNAVVIAFRPAMIKSYSEKNYDYLDHLFYVHNKVLSYLMIGVSLPLIFLMPTILHWWLEKVPEESVFFSQLFVVYVFILVMSNPISTIIQATGRVKYYALIVETITILCLPIAWLFFRLGYPSFTLFVVMIVVCAIAHFARLVCLRHYYPSFSYRKYASSLALPLLLCALAAVIYFTRH